MRTLIRRPAAPVDDDALLQRRRTIEIAALVSRGAGLVCTALAATGSSAAPIVATSDEMRLFCLVGVVLMAAANGLAVLGLRRPGSGWYKALSAMQIALDTATLLGIVVISSRDSSQVTWPLLVLAVPVASLRLQLLGAVLVSVTTSLGFALLVPDSRDSVFLFAVSFLIAIITGTQASSLDRHVTALNETRRALQHQATHDPLTGLRNRAQLAGYAGRFAGRPLAVLLLDLNGFKQVNDTHGHAAGDRLLHEVGARLTTVLGGEGLAGRLGGDEFLVLLPEADTAAVARAVVRIREAIRRPVDIGDGRQVTVGVSASVAIRPAGGDAGLDALSAEADAAMYRDKRSRPRAA